MEDNEGKAALAIAVLQEKVNRLEAQQTDIDAIKLSLTTIEQTLANQKSFVAGIIFLASGIIGAFAFALTYFKH